MQKREYDWIMTLFRPDDRWRRWPNMAEYLPALDAWRPIHTFTDAQLVRYMLVGFYSDYRTANHLGTDFQTHPDRWMLHQHPYTPHQAKVATFNRVFGRPIEDSLDYLGIITGTSYHDFDWFPHGFFAFVLLGYGHALNESSPAAAGPDSS